MVLRPVRKSRAGEQRAGQVVHDIMEQMKAAYPSLGQVLNQKLFSVAGVSRDIDRHYAGYSDKEILDMRKMEKYLAKSEIIESLY